MRKFVIEDQSHAEYHWEFDSFDNALKELKRISLIPWNKKPNRCPCISWETCNRDYEIIEYTNGNEVDRKEIVEIWSKWIKWIYEK